MFAHLDTDFDFYVSPYELDQREREGRQGEENEGFPVSCHLTDIMDIADFDLDGRLTVTEFSKMFSELLIHENTQICVMICCRETFYISAFWGRI